MSVCVCLLKTMGRPGKKRKQVDGCVWWKELQSHTTAYSSSSSSSEMACASCSILLELGEEKIKEERRKRVKGGAYLERY